MAMLVIDPHVLFPKFFFHLQFDVLLLLLDPLLRRRRHRYTAATISCGVRQWLIESVGTNDRLQCGQ